MTTSSTATEPPTQAPIDVDLLFLVNQAAFALTAEMTSALADIAITPREFCVLSHALKGDMTQIRLAELSALDKTTMVVTLDKLEKAGLAERRLSHTRPTGPDRRRHPGRQTGGRQGAGHRRPDVRRRPGGAAGR